MNMEYTVSYRLSLEEIIYLSAAQKDPVKTLFGLRSRLLPSQPEDAQAPPVRTWGDVKQGLLDKQVLWDRNGRLTLCSERLGQAIQAVSKPMIMAAIRPYSGKGAKPMTRLYVRGGFAASVDDDGHSENYYMVRAHTSSRQAQQILEETFYFGDKTYRNGSDSMAIEVPELEGLMKMVSEENQPEFCDKCCKKGLTEESSRDLYGALRRKDHLTSYIIYAFDPAYSEGRRHARESLLYGGEDYMWRIGLTPNDAQIYVTSREAVMEDLRVIAKLMDFV